MSAEMPSLETCSERYAFLFNGELPFTPLDHGQVLGVAVVGRMTHRKGYVAPAHSEHVSQLSALVSDVLLQHDLEAGAKSGEDGALFSFIHDDYREIVGQIATRVCGLWELSRYRNEAPYLFSQDNDQARWLIVEVASAILSAAVTAPVDVVKNVSDRKCLTRVIARWGPEFSRQWFNGTIIREWAARQGLKESEQVELLEALTPGDRKHIIRGDPFKALEAIRKNIYEVLTTKNIAARLGWSLREVDDFFTPYFRKDLAIRYIADPQKGVDLIKHNLEEVLTEDRLVAETRLTPAEVKDIFKPHVLRRMIKQRPRAPLILARVIATNIRTLTHERVAAELGWTVQEAHNNIPKRVLHKIAINYVHSPMKALTEWCNGELEID